MANFTPLGSNRRWPREGIEMPPSSGVEYPKLGFVDATGHEIVKPQVSGACRKCGYPGHLSYQCRNTIPLNTNMRHVVELSSTSSESEYETPLKALRKEKEAKKEKKREKKLLKKIEKRIKKEKKLKKVKKRKRHSSSSSSTNSSNSSSSTDSSSSEIEQKKKARKKSKKLKKSHTGNRKEKKSKRSRTDSL